MTVEWIQPAAFAGLAAVAGPIVVHLLRRRRAARITFPSLRFLQPSRAAAIRVHAPADLRLLALRILVLAAAAAAWAQPLVMSAARQAKAAESIVRAIVIDSTPSMGGAGSIEAVRQASAREQTTAIEAIEIAATDLEEGIQEASRRLDGMRLARREIVVISDFPHGSLDRSALGAVSADVGIRLVPVPIGPPPASFSGPAGFHAPGVGGRVANVELDGDATRVTLTATPSGGRSPRVLAPAAAGADVDRMLRAVASAGAPSISDATPVAIVFPGAPMPAVSALQAPWMLQALLTMRGDRALAAEARRTGADTEAAGVQVHDRADAEPRFWTAVARDADGRPIVALAAAGQELVVRVGAAPSSYLAALALRSLLIAVSADPAWIEHETVRIPPAMLQDWSRQPGPIPDWRWRHAAPGDARWLWALVLALLAVEMVVRRTTGTRESSNEGARAA